MNIGSDFIRSSLEALPQKNQTETVQIYPGIELFYFSLIEDSLSIQHGPLGNILQINYCRTGQAVWTMGNGVRVYLNPGNVSLHTMGACVDSHITFPTKTYQGLMLCIDLSEISVNPPELLADADIFGMPLLEKFCRGGAPAILTGNEQTENIFSGFYDQPETLRLPCQRVKALELILYLAGMDFSLQSQRTEYRTKQIEIVRKIHDQLLQHMDQRVTIEELSRQYLINPTTLKAAFKSVYGTSLAAHIREHRMEQAAKLLRESDMSIAEIAQAVGYDSQSKFTAAFKAVFHVLPREYRKRT